jgi:hypothetical protein
MENKQSIRSRVNLIFKAVAVSMGITVIVLGTLGTLGSQAGMLLLGIGLAALAIAALR